MHGPADRPYELHLDGQTVGRFARASGLESEEADTFHLPGLRRAVAVTLEDGRLAAEYEDWLEHGRSQVGKHGEISGPGSAGAATRWLFEEGWPTQVSFARGAAAGEIALAALGLEIEGVVPTTQPPQPPPPSPGSASPSAATRRRGFWQRLLRRR